MSPTLNCADISIEAHRTAKQAMDGAKVYDIVSTDEALRETILNAFNGSQQLRASTLPGTTIAPRDWQVNAVSELPKKRDTIVITATGSGKSLTYLLALIANPGKVLLAVFPLLSLMADQVC